MSNKLDPAAKSLRASADTVREAVETVQEAADRVDSQVAGSVEPGIREVRHYIADLNAKTDARLKRLLWGTALVIFLQVVVLVLILAG